MIEELKQCWPQLPASAIESVTLHYLSGEIQIELDLPIWILRDLEDARQLVSKLKKAIDVLPYVSDVQVRFKV